jgi:hypothetical protein
VKRIIVYGLWAIGLGWLVIWGISAMVRDTMPTGVVWAGLSMVVWWMVGSETKKDNPKED